MQRTQARHGVDEGIEAAHQPVRARCVEAALRSGGGHGCRNARLVAASCLNCQLQLPQLRGQNSSGLQRLNCI